MIDPLDIVIDMLGLGHDGRSRSTLAHCIESLALDEQRVLSLAHEHSMNSAEIGATLGMSATKAEQLYLLAIIDLRRLLARH